MADATKPGIALVGAGSIGIGWAIVFARAGHAVRLFDVSSEALARAPDAATMRLRGLADAGLIDEAPEAIAARITTRAALPDAVAGAALVLEQVLEKPDLKRAVFAELDRVAPPDAVLASSSSSIPASVFADGLAGRARCLVAHPGNPPYLVPVVEIVPAPFTDPAIADRTADLFARCGMTPVRVAREVEGFVFNRLQGALLREAYCLVRDGVMGVADIDALVRDGLGLRWSVIGPFETADLNTRGGIRAHAARMGPAYARMGAERGQNDPWSEDLVARVEAERRAALPIERWEDGVRARDVGLMRALAARHRGASS